MTTTLDPRPHAAALKNVLDASLTPRKSYDYDEVPGTEGNRGKVPDIYVEITVEQVPAIGTRMTGQTGTRSWIVSVRGIGRTIDEARWALFRAATALHERVLVVEGVETEPLQPQPGQAPEKDGDRYSGLLVFTYSH